MELLMIYKISPSPSLPKRGKERENFPKEGEGKGRNDPLDYAKSQNLNHSRSLAEPCDLCLSKAAILKLWRYLRSTDSPNFFTASEGLHNVTVFT